MYEALLIEDLESHEHIDTTDDDILDVLEEELGQ